VDGKPLGGQWRRILPGSPASCTDEWVAPQKTYLVRRAEGQERTYELYELTWLWRTGEMAHDATFRDETGQWRPLCELVEPVLLAQPVVAGPAPKSNPSRWHSPAMWWGVVLALVVGTVGMAGPDLYRRYTAWRDAKQAEREALERERAARIEDFVASNLVVPGMTREEVRRTIGPPRSIHATGDRGIERWVYRKQVVVLENGKVTGFEDLKE
jgi:hypothetical protein